MKLDPVNLLGGFYQDDNLPWSSQDTVNWLPRPAEQPGTISPLKLAGAPGLNYLTEIDDAPIRIGGMRNVEGKLFVVSGTTLYEVSTAYVATARGTIPGVGPVSMSHNQQEFGNELTVVNGDSGYVFNTFTNSFAQINDDAFNGSVQVDYLNRRNIHMDPFGRFMFPSDIDDASSFDSLDRTDSEASPDRFVGLGVSQLELVGFSQRTIEFYQDTGATEQPFRPKRIAIQRGCASRDSIVQLGTLMWLGDDGIFYALNGYQEQAISTGPIHKAIEDEDWSQCFGFIWEDRKHKVAYWTFPSGRTWGYDVWTGLWHRRQSFGMDRWRLNALVKWNGKWIGGDFRRGRLYEMDWDTFHEAGQPLVATRTAPPIYSNGNTVVCPLLELKFDTGRGTLNGNNGSLSVSGDLVDGDVGDIGTYSYSASGGVQPYSFSILSGSLPPGAAISTDGEVTFDYETAGEFSWVVQVEDAVGQTATLPDSNRVYASGPWFYGPVAEDGPLGGSQAFYMTANNPLNWSGDPIPLPSGMADLGRISAANGAVFFHGGTAPTMGRVSFDAGVTWSVCNIRLDINCDVYWNGSFYYNGANMSADGITWAAIPGLLTTPVGGTAFARESDGAVIVAYPAGTVGISLDNGANWEVKALPFSAPISGVESDGSRVCGSMPSGIGFGYTDNLFTSVTSVPGDGFTDYTDYFDGVWLGRAVTTVRRSETLEAGSFSDVLTSQGAVGSFSKTIGHSTTHWVSLQNVGVGQYVAQVSDDGGITWDASPDTLYGNGESIAYPARI